MWGQVRQECTKFYCHRKRVVAMKLTGNPTDEELDRCAQLLYSHGTQTVSHMYDCIRNPKYVMKAKFTYWEPFRFLASKT